MTRYIERDKTPRSGKWKETPTKTHSVGKKALAKIRQNLATLPQHEMDKINLDKNVCLARYHCKGRNRRDRC